MGNNTITRKKRKRIWPIEIIAEEICRVSRCFQSNDGTMGDERGSLTERRCN